MLKENDETHESRAVMTAQGSDLPCENRDEPHSPILSKYLQQVPP